MGEVRRQVKPSIVQAAVLEVDQPQLSGDWLEVQVGVREVVVAVAPWRLLCLEQLAQRLEATADVRQAERRHPLRIRTAVLAVLAALARSSQFSLAFDCRGKPCAHRTPPPGQRPSTLGVDGRWLEDVELSKCLRNFPVHGRRATRLHCDRAALKPAFDTAACPTRPTARERRDERR